MKTFVKKLFMPMILAFTMLATCLFPAVGARTKTQTASAQAQTDYETTYYFSDILTTIMTEDTVMSECSSDYFIKSFDHDVFNSILSNINYSNQNKFEELLATTNCWEQITSEDFSYGMNNVIYVFEFMVDMPNLDALYDLFEYLRLNTTGNCWIGIISTYPQSNYNSDDYAQDYAQLVDNYFFADILTPFAEWVVECINEGNGFDHATIVLDYDLVKVGMTGENDYNNSRFLTAFMSCAEIEFDGLNEEEINIFVENSNKYVVRVLGDGMSGFEASEPDGWSQLIEDYQDGPIYFISYIPMSSELQMALSVIAQRLIDYENVIFEAYALQIGPVQPGGLINIFLPTAFLDWDELQRALGLEFLP